MERGCSIEATNVPTQHLLFGFPTSNADVELTHVQIL